MRLAVNARVVAHAMGGQQRVTAEILKRLGDCEIISPKRPVSGVAGHAWEQTVLPLRARNKLLWSPSATGPLIHSRQVLTLHDVAFLDTPEFFSGNFVRLYRALIPRLARRVAKIVTVSEFSRGRIAKLLGVDFSAIDVIENGVSENFRQYAEPEIARTRTALNLPARFLLLQATSDRRKNLQRALEAWKEAQARLAPELLLVVSGNMARAHVFGKSGPLTDWPRTRFLGFVDEAHIGPLTAAAEGFLFPSIYEGFGLPIIEAMACGTPVLTANASATAEIAADAALLVDPLDTRSIAAGVVELVHNEDLRRRLHAAGLTRARRFSWDAAASRYRELFRRLGRS